MKDDPTKTLPVLEALRRAHCSHEAAGEPGHGCAGEVTITPTGVKLACVMCGTDATDHVDQDSWGAQVARGVCEAAGLEWDAICPARQAQAVRVVSRLRCPGCARVHRPDPTRRSEDIRCECGAWLWESWRKAWRQNR